MTETRQDELDELLDRAEELLDGEDPEGASRVVKTALRRFPDSADAWAMMGEALESLGDLPAAIVALGRASELAADWASLHAHLAYLELETGALADAARHIDRAFSADDGDPEACYAFAVLCELEGERGRAERFYRRAAHADPRFHVPCRVSEKGFEHMVREVVEDLPGQVTDFLGDVPILVRDLPERDDRGLYKNAAPLLLGECIGSHMEQRGALDLVSATPARILLYQLNLERVCSDEAELRAQIRITVLHEVLHFLGLDEREVDGRGLA